MRENALIPLKRLLQNSKFEKPIDPLQLPKRSHADPDVGVITVKKLILLLMMKDIDTCDRP